MASSSSELTLDLRPAAAADLVPKAVGVLLRESTGARRRELLEEYVKRLEEERRKIDGFRRELPLCMLLISDAIEALKAEAAQCGTVMEEFMPVVKRKVAEEAEEEEGGDGVKVAVEEKDACDKMSWMSSAQLWSDTNRNNSGSSSGIAKKMNEVAGAKQVVADELNRSSAGRLFSGGCKYRAGGGAFTPFKSCSALPSEVGRVDRKVPVPELSLRAPPACRSVSEESGSSATRSMSTKNNSHSTSSTANLQTSPAQASPARKPRRCWSPDLHRRFISALEQLGGPYVATPKQIREIMQVDGLTNDEVKSHLQKYRLHAKRVPASVSTSNQPVVMLGGVWVPRDPCRPSKSSISHSGSPQGPLELATASRAGFTGEDEDGKSESFPSTSAEDVTE